MSREPSYPDDAPVGSGPAAADKPAEGGRGKHIMTGAAIGIGSAAIVAALLWANRSKKQDKAGEGRAPEPQITDRFRPGSSDSD